MSEKMAAFVCYRNSDLNEGRGYTYPYAVCRNESTARRLCVKADVQGTDASYREVELVKVGPTWFGPVNVIQPNKADDIAEDAIRREKTAKLRKDRALDAARKAGLSEDDIAALVGVAP